MKPLPFPLPLRIGTDIVHTPRISRLLNRADYLTRFTRRILDPQEQADFTTRFKETLALHGTSTNPPITADMTRWLAGRFAAKEAARKAAPEGAAEIGWKDVVVRAQGGIGNKEDKSSIPEIVYWPEGRSGNPGSVGRLSISHDGEYAFATVLAWTGDVHSHSHPQLKGKEEKGKEKKHKGPKMEDNEDPGK
ncbi:Phosphopantetheinyl transferase PptB [Penicillium atrosanguineum]|uniref:Phosphopantetheinyl transferase PptB n=1 Tax=Penicillium atrosanguineum TaxID=1132637 RepID=A0A9W9PWW7_9EURO|nr:uncharacterized protein N7443_005742 [Penicillium atrosanguineum]KAJ5128622.1 Phosphopantetheinyl transferase PptB [Penicillium atrosanguineum]KAJ5144946.1 Phosphopantetheinyl transferase PptB [Penicillium atrosanguineum]KAJ5300740.1 hypothetical protein N7443_005742 [Penicillium atrosanguineum]KAJ5311382.1 Phosphopantetheinyl transferase PptB [Penicillium atrosanguineum]